jgi:hypothetical protein
MTDINSTDDIKPDVKFEELSDDVRAYLSTTTELYKLKAVDKLAVAGGNIAAYAVIVLVSFLALVLLSIGLGAWFNELLNSNYLGYFIVAGIYIIIGLLVIATQNNMIKRPVSSIIIKGILNED